MVRLPSGRGSKRDEHEENEEPVTEGDEPAEDRQGLSVLIALLVHFFRQTIPDEGPSGVERPPKVRQPEMSAFAGNRNCNGKETIRMEF